MNNKGAIFSGFMYVLLVFFLLSLAALLVVLNDTKKISNKAREGAQDIIEDESSEFVINLTGSNSICMNFGVPYSEPGFSAKDKEGNPLTVTVASDLDIWKVGTYTVTYTAKDKGKEKSVERKVHVIKNDYAYANTPQEFITKCDGYYTIEVWGARHNNGMGGYTKGTIKLSKNDALYVYTGEFNSVGNATAFNGGTGTSGGYPGGGATDVRLLNKNWNDLESLKSRIIVAGGAGAGNIQYSHGGGLIGVKSGTATAGTQTTPGTGGYTAASFGIGGGGCGGGGGYYGAGGATCAEGGAGGSAFISGGSGVNAITNDLTVTHSNNTLHYSGKYFVNTTITTGINNGFGKAKITYIGPTYQKVNANFNSVRYVKNCINGSTANADNHWVELQVIKDGLNIALNSKIITTITENPSYPFSRIVDGDITSTSYAQGNTGAVGCVTVDLGKVYDIDEVAVWHFYNDGRTYTTPTTEVSIDNTTWKTIMNTPGPETSNGFRANAWN